MPASAPPRTRSGGKTSPGRAGSMRPSTVAPIWRSGSATRRIGRRVSEASPHSSVSNGRPASRPMSRRMVVPELPQSSGAGRRAQAREADAADARLVARRARCRRPARAAPPPSTGCRRPARARAPRRRRPRARRTAAPGARSTCRPGPGRSRAAGPIAGPSACASLLRPSSSRCHRTSSPVARLASPPTAGLREHLQHREQLLRQPLALARRRCAGGRGRAIPRRATVSPRRPAPSPSSMTICCRA